MLKRAKYYFIAAASSLKTSKAELPKLKKYGPLKAKITIFIKMICCPLYEDILAKPFTQLFLFDEIFFR